MIGRIAIVGDGVGGWLAAAAILRAFQSTRRVSVIAHDRTETGDIATDAGFVRFLGLLGIADPPGTPHWGNRVAGPDGSTIAFVPAGGAPGGAFATPPGAGPTLAADHAAALEAAWRRDGQPGLRCSRAVLAGVLRGHALAMGAVEARSSGDEIAAADLIVDTAGAGAAAWDGRRVRIGGADDTPDAAALAQKGVSQLLQLFPSAWPAPALAGEYVRRLTSLRGWYDDAAVLRACAAGEAPPAGSARLTRRIALFAANGRLTHAEDDPLPGAAWHSLLLACGIVPPARHWRTCGA